MPGWGWANLPPLIPSHSEAVGGESATTPLARRGMTQFGALGSNDPGSSFGRAGTQP